ncbi:MAG: hypothetical protein WBN97_03605 [Parvibaculum sp.]
MKNSDLASKSPLRSAADSANDAKVSAANEDSPTAGAIYRLLARRPAAAIPQAAFFATIALLGAGGLALWSWLGPDRLASLTPLETTGLALAILLPVVLVWLIAFITWRGAEMQLMSEALAKAAIRLADPADHTADDITTLAQAVRREVDLMRAGLGDALTQAADLKALVSRELDDIERGTGRAEFRARAMEELLTRHKTNLQELGTSLGSESDTIARAIRMEVESIRSLTGKAEADIRRAGERVVEQTTTLARVSEAARAGADATSSTLDRQASRLEVVANNALARADSISQHYENQRQQIAEAADRLEQEHQHLQGVFEAYSHQMNFADAALAAHTAEIGKAVKSLAAGLDDTFMSVEGKTRAMREAVTAEIARAGRDAEETSAAVSRSAGAATRAIAATVDELKSITGTLKSEVVESATSLIRSSADDLRQATSDMTTHLSQAVGAISTDLTKQFDLLQLATSHALTQNNAAAQHFHEAMQRLGTAAREAGAALTEAAGELDKRMETMPLEAAQSAQALGDVLSEQVNALATISEIVVRHARSLDRTSPLHQMQRPAAPTLATPPASSPRMTPDAPRNRGRLSDLLAAADRRPEPVAEKRHDGADRDFHRASLHVIETLQSLAIDLDRALEQSPPADLWRRYKAGERNVFARRLYNLAGRELYDQVAVKYRNDSEFRAHVDRFIGLFEDLLDTAAERDRDNILVETYLSSDTGKVYLMLAQATGRVG